MVDRQDGARDGAVSDAPAVQGLRQLLRRVDRVGAERLVPGDEDHRLGDEPNGLGRGGPGPDGGLRLGHGALDGLPEIGSGARHVEHYSRRGMTYTTRSMKGTRFDHIAIGMERMADATDFLVGRLGGVPDSGGPGGGFRWAAWTFEGGGSIEVIEPAGADGFLHRFLAARGPGLHHVTFKVSSLADAAARAEAQGYRLVGRDETDPDWLVAYLHPKEALGVVVQLGQSGGRYGRRPGRGAAGSGRAAAPGPGPRPPDAGALGGAGASPVGAGARRNPGPRDGAELVFRWPGSPMRIVAEIAPDADEGPLAIELGPEPPLRAGLPPGPVPRLGTVFLVDRRPIEPERGLTGAGI